MGGKDEKKTISSNFGHTGEIGQYYPLEHIMKMLGHTSVDLLKMDIERHEFAVVDSLVAKFAPRQIVFETHLHNAYGIWGRAASTGMASILEQDKKSDYRSPTSRTHTVSAAASGRSGMRERYFPHVHRRRYARSARTPLRQKATV